MENGPEVTGAIGLIIRRKHDRYDRLAGVARAADGQEVDGFGFGIGSLGEENGKG